MKSIQKIVLLFILFPTLLFAIPKTKNLTIDADSFEMNALKNIITAEGNVVLKQKGLEIHGKQAKYFKKTEKANIYGGVKIIKEGMVMFCDTVEANGKTERVFAKGNIRFELSDINGTSDSARYDTKAQKVILIGSPKVMRNLDTLTGEKIYIDLKTEKVRTVGKARIVIVEGL